MHQMLSDTLRHPQLVHVEHADEVIASLVGTYDGLCGVHRREPPHVEALADARERFLEARLADTDAVNDLRCELGAHEADLGGRPRRDVVRMPSSPHAHVRAAVALAN